ncbi:Protein of unknown function [Cotesia congregata]|uniref:Uncharacterized protein n=1 Tax=Cotesia congregata TaxID=51543 RepID=A0A8J2MGW1_COTCN|nr:Protein of unknown function [Cotesia congregata]
MESKLRFNRSCNPLKIANHKNRSGLRRASVKLQNSWNLRRSQSISGEELTRTISQLSLNTQLPVINDALALLNISPLDRFAIDRPSYLSGKYNEICSIFAKLLELDNVSNHYENSVNYHEILENLKDKFKAENTPQTLKVQILTLLPSDWSINKICDVMGATKHMAILSKSLKERKGILSEPEKKQVYNYNLFIKL